MKKFFYGIGGKIKQGYIAIVVLFLVISGITFYQSLQNRNDDTLVNSKYFPLSNKLVYLKHTLENSERLVYNWANQPNKKDKDKLIAILESEFPNLKSDIEDIAIIGDITKEEKNVLTILDKINALIPYFKTVTLKLAQDEDYANDENIDAANETIFLNITPEIKYINEKLTDAISAQQNILNSAIQQKQDRFNIQIFILLISIIIFICISLYASYYASNTIVKPINNLKEIINSMSKGEIKEVEITETKDEIGDMVAATKTMLKGMKTNTNFALEVGKGNYESDFMPLGDLDELGNSLKEMRTNLKLNSEKDHERNWTTAGVAQMGEILRNNQNDIDLLYRDIIKFIVKYLEINQGGLFVINENNEDDKFIEMVGCYAYDKEKKNISKRLELQDSIIGESIRDLDTIILTEIPDQYFEITSGLGQKTAGFILIVPLKVNEEAYGAVELASFSKIDTYKIEFVEKIAESVASTMSAVKKNTQTQKLLQELQIQEEYLRSQEEEMRQNLEELNSTQELMRAQEQQMLGIMQDLSMRNESLLEKEQNYLSEIKQLKLK